jgi:CBS domain-containing protein
MSSKTKALNEKLVHVAKDNPLVVKDSDSVAEVLSKMRGQRTACALVAGSGKLVGIFTERDHLMKVAGQAEAARKPIRDFMTPNPVRASLDGTVGDAIETMNAKGLRNLPVVDAEGKPAFLITVGGIIRYLADHFPAAVVNRPPQPHVSTEHTDGA